MMSRAEPAPPPPGVTDPQPPAGLVPCLVYAALCGSVVAGLGNPIVVEVSRELRVSLEAAQWALTVTLLFGVVSTPIVARIADGRLRTKVLTAALVIVALGCLVGAVLPTYAGLVTGRALNGLGYTLVALTVGIAREHLSGRRLARTLAVLSTSLAVGAGLANPAVGLAVGLWDYRAGFVLAFVVCLVGVVWTWRALPEPLTHVDPIRADPWGALLLVTGLGLALLAITHGNSWGWHSAGVLAMAVAGILLLVAFTAVELRLAHPLVDLRLAVSSGVLGANLGALLIGWSVFAGAGAAIILVQQRPAGGVGLGLSVFVSGLLMGPMALGSLVSPWLARRLADRVGERALLPIAAAACTIAFGVFAVRHHSPADVLLMMGLMGLGVGVGYSVLPNIVVARTPPERTASATGVNQVRRLLGGAVGAAVAVAVLVAHTDPATGLPADSGYVAASLVSSLVALAAVPLTWWLVPPRPSSHRLPTPPEPLG